MTADDRTGDDPSPLARRRYEPGDGGELSTAIVRTIAAIEDVPTDGVSIPPLYDCVDVEALDRALFGTPGTSGGAERATFRCGTYRVAVAADGWIRIYGD
ncbi:HalOD1 output domain-containing protein [Haloplanus litoreus]|uniref:HalOD1 output domain-containing protein n=1 Tax=Haloplanus litoreus TaxID=767515 RepID=A0ABD5ZXV7_9EURY